MSSDLQYMTPPQHWTTQVSSLFL
uniref:Uncharacterized protein n=1 Tax=Zea mays TaxID=4577 RepID=C4J2P5_MAIZE|nr:unknown [Zea mays]